MNADTYTLMYIQMYSIQMKNLIWHFSCEKEKDDMVFIRHTWKHVEMCLPFVDLRSNLAIKLSLKLFSVHNQFTRNFNRNEEMVSVHYSFTVPFRSLYFASHHSLCIESFHYIFFCTTKYQLLYFADISFVLVVSVFFTLFCFVFIFYYSIWHSFINIFALRLWLLLQFIPQFMLCLAHWAEKTIVLAFLYLPGATVERLWMKPLICRPRQHNWIKKKKGRRWAHFSFSSFRLHKFFFIFFFCFLFHHRFRHHRHHLLFGVDSGRYDDDIC